nr:immunoglobulin heavy chain junction region [Macaca mulatta]MOV49180.1 immunoglobulin heavy chain junction region [Macaca mulatta]MOV51178.1 immunoglobulin heavy chain junction region [Macaca mulatta]MOV52433.1 immunoglobulin heavy chain junction region [Macaca mulatta]MOV52652.1 immunoglobulin heavy chain junction region [Macaca mulatta]
CARVNTEFDFW